ncbi:MAG: mandelate racemase/muconate lactonizing enzyme family protein [Firmicutes bacterium]|nr:mandelate racemase/muconate lactonizing enzyme family protein [Bacillota bacterium]
MKITSVDLIKCKELKASMQVPVLCRINTDEGIYGYGEAGVSIDHYSLGCFELMKRLCAGIIGMDPLENDVIYHKLANGFWAQGGGGVIYGAISAIDTALWDIKGKAFGVPVYKLLGGKYRDKLRAYASQLQSGWKYEDFAHAPENDPEFFRDACRRAHEEGYSAIKVDFVRKCFGRENREYLTVPSLKKIESFIQIAREEIGDESDLILENHNRTSVNTAIQVAKLAEPYNIMFTEEPCIALNAENYRRLADNINIPIATGERTYLREGFLPLITNRSVSVIQPDLGNCGGITECKKICDLAETYGVMVQTHTCNSPISVAASLQFEAALPNFIIHEHHTNNTTPAVTELGLYDYQPVNGWFEIPELPGIGNELSEKALREAEIFTVK